MRRLLCVLLALAALCGVTPFPVNAAGGGYHVTVAKVQRLTPGTEFNPDAAPEVTSASPGDIIVLTVAFRNSTAAAVDIAGFGAQLNYDKAKVAPYQGTAPFDRNPYQVSTELTSAHQWISAGSAKDTDDFVLTAGGGWINRAVSAGGTLVLAYMAFQVNADASGAAAFTFKSAKTDITPAVGKSLALAAFEPVRVTLGSYEITAVSADRVTLSNPTPVTLAVSYFDASGKFMSASTQSVPADAGSVPVAFGNAHKAYVMLFDDAFRPLCERCLYVME